MPRSYVGRGYDTVTGGSGASLIRVSTAVDTMLEADAWKEHRRESGSYCACAYRVPHAYVILTMSRYMKVSVDFTPSI